MRIELSKLTLTNFKGIKSLVIYFDGNTNIYGANEAGKSTLYAAYLWLLTGKDEFDRKDYEIKNTKHRELNSQAHEVEGIFVVSGQEVKLKRVYLEKWVKQKGQSGKIFEGHKTEYWYNDVPCNQSEYQSKVDQIMDSKILKLLTNPTYFNSLKWEEQRRNLLSIAGTITNDDVFNVIATPEHDYSTLIMVLNGGKSLEEWKRELAAKKSLLKKAASEFQPRIDELKRSLPEQKDWQALEQELSTIKREIEVIDEVLLDATKAQAEKQKGILSKQSQLHGKQSKFASIRFKILSDLQEQHNLSGQQITAIQNKIKEIATSISRLEKQMADSESNIAAYQRQIEAKEAIIVTLRNDWNSINAEHFQFDESKCECPTCKQQLPDHDIEKMREELLKNFNESVARRKADKVEYSNQVKKEIKQLQENIEALKALDHLQEIAVFQHNIKALESRLQELQATEAKKHVGNIEVEVEALLKVNADALNLRDEITCLEAEIKSDTEALVENTDTSKHKEKKQQLQAELDRINKELAAKAVIERTTTRIQQLEAEERNNAQAIADLEQQEFEVETFTRAKMDILEKKVNGMFRYVQWRLFDQQVNGAIAETCVCEYNGVPYPTLNTAAKLLAGLDVLNTLSKFYNVYAPVFCDNRESVTMIPETSCQIISLFVSPEDKKLRVETVGRKLKLETLNHKN
jgi:chromosome segregation ATPase